MKTYSTEELIKRAKQFRALADRLEKLARMKQFIEKTEKEISEKLK